MSLWVSSKRWVNTKKPSIFTNNSNKYHYPTRYILKIKYNYWRFCNSGNYSNRKPTKESTDFTVSLFQCGITKVWRNFYWTLMSSVRFLWLSQTTLRTLQNQKHYCGGSLETLRERNSSLFDLDKIKY